MRRASNALPAVLQAVGFYVLTDWLISPHLISPAMRFVGGEWGLRTVGKVISAPRAIIFDVLVFAAGAFAVALMLALFHRREWRSGAVTFWRETNVATGPGWSRRLLIGMAFGGSACIAIVLALASAGAMSIAPFHTISADAIADQVILLVASFAAGFVEEFSFRGFVQQRLTQGVGFWAATFVTSAWFGWAHYGEGVPLIGAASIAGWGVVSCLLLRATGDLAVSIGFHAFWNYFENAIFGVSDSAFLFHGALTHTTPVGPPLLSGGEVGPEGSLLFIALNVLVAGALIVRRRRGQAVATFR